MHNYSVVENRNTGFDAIKLLDEPFAGIIYSYGKVSFEEDDANDKLTINFDYEILDTASKEFGSMEPFEKCIGEILQELIHHGIAENSLTYTGGIDENRDSDSVELDSQ
jgi:hypothetical protein